jgi:methylase of polypeptide subunit release factors
MLEFKINKTTVYYPQHLDGGGTTIGVNSLDGCHVKKFLKKGNLLEICSGPGFMGFFLKENGYSDNLILSDINIENIPYINQTIEKNNLSNVEFLQSDCFDSFKEDTFFDMIVSNPPHFKTHRPGGYRSDHEKLLSLDEDMQFHKRFFKDVTKYLKDDGIIILVENCEGVTEEDIRGMVDGNLTVEYVEYDDYKWKGESTFYTIVLSKNKIKNEK